MNLNALIIKNIGEKSLEFNPNYIKFMSLGIILIIMILALKDRNKAPYIKYVVSLMVIVSVLQGVVLYNHKDKDNYALQILDTQTKEVLSSKPITKENYNFIKNVKEKDILGDKPTEDEVKKIKSIILK